MNIQISVRHMSVPRGFRQLIHNLCLEVHNQYRFIQNIDVVVEDINGPYKSGIDKRCHLSVRDKGHMAVDVDECESELGQVIDHAFSRLYQLLKRRWAFRARCWNDCAATPRLQIEKEGANHE